MKVGDHTVNEDHWAVFDCPDCEETRKVYHLGSAPSGEVGWVCGVCHAELLEDPATNDVRRANETNHA